VAGDRTLLWLGPTGGLDLGKLPGGPALRRISSRAEEDLRNPKLEQLWAGGISSITLKAEGGLFVVAPLEA